MKLATLTMLLSLLLGSSAFAETIEAPEAGEAAATPIVEPIPAAAPARAAADPEEPQTVATHLQGRGMRVSGWFVAPTFTLSSFAGSLAYSPGIRSGIYLDRRLSVGIAAHAVGNEASYFTGAPVRQVGTYGGLLLQYVVHSNRLIHATLESTLGGGRWCVEISEERDGCAGRSFLVFEPVANLEVNLARHVRLAAGVGYRFAAAGGGPGPGSDDMRSLVARTSLIFGSF